MPIFQLNWYYQDSEINYYFEAHDNTCDGNSYVHFNNICDILMREAAQDVVEGISWKSCETEGLAIGYDLLVREVAERLVDYGYSRIEFPKVSYRENLIIRSESNVLGKELSKKVVKYNENLL